MRCYILWISLLLCAGSALAQTAAHKLVLTLPDAEAMFLQKNPALHSCAVNHHRCNLNAKHHSSNHSQSLYSLKPAT